MTERGATLFDYLVLLPLAMLRPRVLFRFADRLADRPYYPEYDDGTRPVSPAEGKES